MNQAEEKQQQEDDAKGRRQPRPQEKENNVIPLVRKRTH